MSVSSLEIHSRQSYADGISFGESGPYQQLDGKAQFSVGPDDASNALITDLTLAPRDAATKSAVPDESRNVDVDTVSIDLGEPAVE